jgi:hypothetical protein
MRAAFKQAQRNTAFEFSNIFDCHAQHGKRRTYSKKPSKGRAAEGLGGVKYAHVLACDY